MAKTKPFEENTERYEEWFERNRFAYESELRAVRMLLPEKGMGMEIGVGSGRFASPLGIRYGVEPSEKMREIAAKRGIITVDGVAEELPYVDSSFDFVLMVTTICFLDDIAKALSEAYRALKPGGYIIIGFVDRESIVGKFYLEHKEESLFYRIAVFLSVDEVCSHLLKAGFHNLTFKQTIFHYLHEIGEIEPVKDGYGEGSFLVVQASKRPENRYIDR